MVEPVPDVPAAAAGRGGFCGGKPGVVEMLAAAGDHPGLLQTVTTPGGGLGGQGGGGGVLQAFLHAALTCLNNVGVGLRLGEQTAEHAG